MINKEKVINDLQDAVNDDWMWQHADYYALTMESALALLKEQPDIVRCMGCKHLFDGEHTENCCEVLMEKAGWLKEISVSPDWFCADGERRQEDDPNQN